jgi:hypothetical protein
VITAQGEKAEAELQRIIKTFLFRTHLLDHH